MADKDGKNVNKDRSEKEDKPEKRSKRGKCSSTASSREKRPAEEPKASTSAMTREQKNEGVDQGEQALLEIVMAGFQTLNKLIVSLRQQDKQTSEEYQLDDLPDDELADLGEVDADSSKNNRLVKNYVCADLVGPEIHVDLAKLDLLSEKQDEASLKQHAEQYFRPANCVFLEAPQMNKEIYGHLSAGHRWGPAGRTDRPPKANNSNY